MLPIEIFRRLGIPDHFLGAGDFKIHSAINRQTIGSVYVDDEASIENKLEGASAAFKEWRQVSALRRVGLLRIFEDQLRSSRLSLAALFTLEGGQTTAEATREVDEMIACCHLASNVSGLPVGSEVTSRANWTGHDGFEAVGPTCIITPFASSAIIWCQNATLAIACGNSVIYKASPARSLTAIACDHLLQMAIEQLDYAPVRLHQLVFGDEDVGFYLANHRSAALVSFAGSSRAGAEVSASVEMRCGRKISATGSNNTAIVTASADMPTAAKAIARSLIRHAGQSCACIRRVFVASDRIEHFSRQINSCLDGLVPGDPRHPKVSIGPLRNQAAIDTAMVTLGAATMQGGKIIYGGSKSIQQGFVPDFHVNMDPTIVIMPVTDAPLAPDSLAPKFRQPDVVHRETLAPILFVMPFDDMAQAIAMQNEEWQPEPALYQEAGDLPHEIAIAAEIEAEAEAETEVEADASEPQQTDQAQSPATAELPLVEWQAKACSLFSQDPSEIEYFLAHSSPSCLALCVNEAPKPPGYGGAFVGQDSWKLFCRSFTTSVKAG